MSDTPAVTLMTSEQLFALPPSKKVDRWLFRGELRESKVTKRNPNHTGAVMALGRILGNWAVEDPATRGRVHGAEAYFRIRRDPETNVGIDVALASPEQQAAVRKKTNYIDGPPVLAVEVLSPNDKQRDIDVAIEEYLECGVKLVWIVNPYTETVAVYRADRKPELVNADEELSGEPFLPGFRCPVYQIFLG